MPKTYTMRWPDQEASNWFQERTVQGGGIVRLEVPFVGNWIAVLSGKN